jgi:hypothetical protein
MKTMLSLVSIMTLLVAAGCGGGSRVRTTQEDAAKAPAPPAGEGHAVAAQVVPGSYEDWCDEHQVPETQCTRCDPSLVPAFQAAGDWDAEHGLPMSQCKIHNPRLEIVRPPKPEAK